ncbi:hypothetical protein L210DRAFT_3589586 [Boletus edulis BED1]|uniref:Uncharacterized protein n=1 Tax=Boletus edulis BED1 TaxID=1328754 RepID=A0AAD4G4K6_BOLED|nr:hypothetical protein L210DRAFT_3589586 [Boletus edulis BED1]
MWHYPYHRGRSTHMWNAPSYSLCNFNVSSPNSLVISWTHSTASTMRSIVLRYFDSGYCELEQGIFPRTTGQLCFCPLPQERREGSVNCRHVGVSVCVRGGVTMSGETSLCER